MLACILYMNVLTAGAARDGSLGLGHGVEALRVLLAELLGRARRVLERLARVLVQLLPRRQRYDQLHGLTDE